MLQIILYFSDNIRVPLEYKKAGRAYWDLNQLCLNHIKMRHWRKTFEALLFLVHMLDVLNGKFVQTSLLIKTLWSGFNVCSINKEEPFQTR